MGADFQAAAADGESFVREAAEEDLDVVVGFRLEFVRSIKALNGGAAEDFRRDQVDMFTRKMRSGDFHLWVYEEGGLVLGSCALDVSAKKLAGELSAVFTKSDQRRRGVASALLKVAIGYAGARGLKTIELQPTEVSLGLYLKFGFKKVGGRMELLLPAPR